MLLRRTTLSRKVDAAFGGVTKFMTPGSTTFTVPAGVTEISAVCVGGGGGGGGVEFSSATSSSGGGGGATAYVSSIPVSPGESLTVVVGAAGAAEVNGGASYVRRASTDLVCANGGSAGGRVTSGTAPGGAGGTVAVGTGGSGGAGGSSHLPSGPGGGGGGGGYSGVGGDGGASSAGLNGGGGGGGGGGSVFSSGAGGGGGVGVGGAGSNGSGGLDSMYSQGGGGGSGGTAGVGSDTLRGDDGGLYGGGGGGGVTSFAGGAGGGGAVSIRWGTNNKFPIPLAYVKGVASAGATSVTLPTHVTGDLIIVFAYRDGNTTQPTLPAGFTAISNASGANTNSATLGYKIAASGSETSGTWTNANAIMAVVIGGANAAPIGGSGVGSTANATVTYPTLTMSDASGNSVVLCFCGHRSVNTTLETPPIGMLRVASFTNATCELACHVTEGGVTAFASRGVLVGGTASGWRAHSVEIKK